jgi:uncharacterized repeat protein (TIGR03847 family)
MSSSFEFDPVERITAGAVGEPGRRVFYVQASAAGQLVTIVAEKEQVNALAQTITRLLAILPDADDEGAEPDDLELQEPLLGEWRAGAMALDYDEERDVLVLIVQEALPEETEEEPATLRVGMTRAQAQALAEHAAEIVQAGRPACRVCGLPLDPEGHICPALNGHRESR